MRGQRLTQLLAFILKEVRQTSRDKRIMVLLVVAPVIQLIMFGFAVNLDVDRVPTVVVDLDGTARSRGYVNGVTADGTLQRIAEAPDAEAAQAMLDNGSASVALILPRGLDRDLSRGQPTEVQVLLDGSDPNRSGVAGGTAAAYFGMLSGQLVKTRLQAMSAARGLPVQLPTLRLSPRIYYNPKLQTAIFMVPGITSALLLLVTTIVTAMGLAREREMGTLEQVLVTPVPPSVMMMGKIIPFLLVGLFDFGLALTVGSWVFEMPLQGSFPFMFLATGLFLVTTLGVGLFISTVSGSQQQAFMGGFFFLLPAMLLSGILTPIRSMPQWLQPLTYVNPVRYYIDILRAALLKGAGVADLWPELLALAVFGTFIVTLAATRFRKQMA